MKIVGVDLHAKQQNIAMLDTETGELTEKLIRHEGNVVRGHFCRAGREDDCTKVESSTDAGKNQRS